MNNCCNSQNDKKEITGLAQILNIISEPNRLKILCLLKSGAKCVCEIHESLDLKQNLVSHHLKTLKDADLINYKKKGKWKHYSLNRKKVKKFKNIFNKLLT